MYLYMTSSPTGSYRQDTENTYPGLNPENGMLTQLKKDWKEQAKCLMISAFPDDYAADDEMRAYFEERLRMSGLSLSQFDICDNRNAEEMMEKLLSYDMLLLGGGHVPTQNAFFHRIGLIQKIKEFEGIVMGISAGSMNCAEVVYVQPELPGESLDESFLRYREGLGLSKVNVLPHYQAVKDDFLDGKRLMEDITYADSYGKCFYCLVDGSYILQREGKAVVYGEAYRISAGNIEKFCEYNEVREI